MRLHRWDLTPKEAVALQRELAAQPPTAPPLSQVTKVAGVDVAYDRHSGLSAATVCILDATSLRLLEYRVAHTPTPFPYVPGLLSFREVPPLLEAFAQLNTRPDLVFVDGHGKAHPRRMGIACHLGLWLQLPTIGIGKSRLCGRFEEPGLSKGESSPLTDRGEMIGCVLRTRTGVKPIIVSEGWGLGLDQCLDWVRRVTPRYRLPEPIRWADRLAAEHK